MNFVLTLQFILFLSLSSLDVSAEVWTSVQSWNEEMEEKYSEWIKTSFADNVFSHPNSSYYGIKTDCADALLVARLIFSFEQKLPFSFKNVDGQIVTEKTNEFNYAPIDKRLVLFANSLADQVSVQNLASENSYYIHPSDIRAGDFYLVRWTNAEGKTNHHAYLIKSILPTGDLELLSSTTPKAVRTLSTRLGMPVQFFSASPFGFKRYKERHSSLNLQEDKTQLQWLKLGENEFYGRVKEMLRTEEDDYQKNFDRRFLNLCRSLELRLEVVLAASKRIAEKNGQCLSSSEFDEFSTPSRDQNIKREFERIINGWKTLVFKKVNHNLPSDQSLGLDYLIGKDNSEEGKIALDNRCRVHFVSETREQFSMGLRSFYQRLKTGLISSDPNQSIKVRYGLSKEMRRCN